MPKQASAQATTTREVELIRADSLTESVVNGERVRNLFGNVRLRQDSTLLQARRDTQFTQRDEYLFVGNVLIVEEGDSLRADSVLYDKRTKIGRATGSVRLTDGEVLVLAPSALYFVNEKRGRFEEGVTLIDSLTELVSRTGTYWSDEKRAEFAENVRLYDTDSYLEADSITHFRNTEISLARGGVFIERLGASAVDSSVSDTTSSTASPDSTVRTWLFGDEIYNDKKAGISRARGKPLLLQLRTDSTGVPTDTLVISAKYLESVEADSMQRLIAVDSVQVWQTNLAACADSLVFDRIDLGEADGQETYREETRLFVNPSLWVQGSQITGDTIRVVSTSGELDSLFVQSTAFVAQQDSASGRLNQMRGQNLVGIFDADSSRTFTIAPSAEAIFQLQDDEDRPDGAVRMSGDRLVFSIHDDQPRKVDLTGDPTGTLYTEALVSSPLNLAGLKWTPDKQPQKGRLLDRPAIQQRLLRMPSRIPHVVEPGTARSIPADQSRETQE